jgi:hypothetical protein
MNAWTPLTSSAKPEKMAWMFDYHIDWNAPIPSAARPSAGAIK